MPELPEVETLKLGLQRYIVGKTIESVDVRDRKLFSGDESVLGGAEFVSIRRFAKGIVMDLDNGYSLAAHIKLTGQLIYRDSSNKDMVVQKPRPMIVPNKFTRAVFKLKDQKSGNSFLYFQEVRGFAWMRVVRTDEVGQLLYFKNLGPEILPSKDSDQARMTESEFEQMLSKTSLPVKVAIMDQKKIGGVGNIYANEALFDAGIDPRRKAQSLTSAESKALYSSLLKVLQLGLKYRGSSELNYVDILGQTGQYQKHVQIYGKKGKPCPRDGSLIEKIYLGGRGTFFCTHCQK
jgi:formamidopyrimidine-DNA glycosylase